MRSDCVIPLDAQASLDTSQTHSRTLGQHTSGGRRPRRAWPGRTSRPQSKDASAVKWSAGVLRLRASTLARRCAPLRMPAVVVCATAHTPFLAALSAENGRELRMTFRDQVPAARSSPGSTRSRRHGADRAPAHGRSPNFEIHRSPCHSIHPGRSWRSLRASSAAGGIR